MEPVGWKVQYLSRLHNYFIDISLRKLWELIQVRVSVVHLAVTRGWMALWVEAQVL